MTSFTVRVLLLAILVGSCSGQWFDYYFPRVAKTTRKVTSTVVNSRIVQRGADVVGYGLVKTGDILSRIPLALARVAKKAGLGIPTLDTYFSFDKGRSSGLINRFVRQFKVGSGNEDAALSIDELLTKYGYKVEKHQVETSDGYILSMFRIPGNGSAVLLMHGLLGSADDFVLSGPNNSLAYLLADRGYDVWMGNARGNKHSRLHKYIDPSDSSFWDFTWHEIGYYDLAAMIDYTLYHNKVTNTIKYVGYSQGTTAFFVLMSERPEYNVKVSQMIAMSPVVFMGQVKSPLVRILAPGGPVIYAVNKVMGSNEFLPDKGFTKAVRTVLCGSSAVSEIMCSNIMFLIAGYDWRQLDVYNLPVLLGHIPAGCAMKQLLHFGQGVVSGEFRQFDFGKEKNQIQYGSMEPPRYNLQKVTVPVTLFYSDNDWLSHPDDVQTLYQSLGSKNKSFKLYFSGYNHLDYIFAKNLRELVFQKIVYVFQLYDGV